MTATATLSLADIERRLCDLTSERLAIRRDRVTPASRFAEDLGCDSLDLVEFFMATEEAFDITLPDDSGYAPEPVTKAVFTRSPFRVCDLAEVVYLQLGTGTPVRSGWGRRAEPASVPAVAPFTQLGGVWRTDGPAWRGLYEPLGKSGEARQFRRRSDGMRCVLIPGAAVEIGTPGGPADEGPGHTAEVGAFLIDAEPVSATAYCRFLNSVAADRQSLADWFVLDPSDDRNAQAVVTHEGDGWRPAAGCERVPMVLVSWHGANAYSLWANGHDWAGYRAAAGFLPTEAQWEYAARGPRRRAFPWGDDPATPERACYGRHRRGDIYRAETMPMAAITDAFGLSPFGLSHMAGTVWQWCRDWYAGDFYRTPAARAPDPVNATPTGVRSERGGSWVGPASLCRSSARRGRPPAVRGRCLGFRCVGANLAGSAAV